MSKQPLSERLKAARKKLGLTQAQAAIAWGINRRTLENWESGRFSPQGFAALQLEKLLNEALKGK